jgi:lipoprotein-releasing system permease protein
MKGRGFHWFVALRYLRGAQYGSKDALRVYRSAVLYFLFGPLARLFAKSSRVLWWITAACFVSTVGFIVWRYAFLSPPKPGSFREPDPWLQITELGAVISGALTVIFATLTILRRVFSFFSTVSIAGVWIGTMALVFVLSVMSGFESDLRQKILGSNAHIQVTREEGDFIEWEDVKKRVEGIPGVVASTPFAVSEVVIAANNAYFNVIIKGIDPESIGAVTQLKEDLLCGSKTCDKKAAEEIMGRLDPLVDDVQSRDVPQKPDPGTGGPTTDEPPPDMVDGTEPIDFSKPHAVDPGADDKAKDQDDTRGGLDPDTAPPADFGGDAPAVLGVDSAGGDADEPTDFSGGDDTDLLADDAADLGADDDDDGRTVTITSSELSPPSKRTKSLPGVLVGKELTKQIHLYPDQEVRMVSPLSDPANPDATGTPIPFNRDYRVAGMFFTGMYEYDLKFVYVTLDSLQDFLDRGDAVDGLEVRIEDPDETADVVAALQNALGKDYRVQDWQELNRSLFSALKLEKIAMFLVLAIIILVASFSIVGNLVMVVVEKGKEIALMKTLGASDRAVTWIFVTQGFFIGLIGTGLGVLDGLIGCALAKRFGIPINPDVYYIDKLPIHVDVSSVLLIAAAGMLISVGATVYPALVASRLAPSVGLRH